MNTAYTTAMTTQENIFRVFKSKFNRPLMYNSGYFNTVGMEMSRSKIPTPTIGQPKKKLYPAYTIDSYNVCPDTMEGGK